MVDERELYKAYKKFYRLGYFDWMKGLTGKPEHDLRIERIAKLTLYYYQNRSAEREKLMRRLAKALGISERKAYDLRRAYSKGAVESPLLRSFFSHLSLVTSRNEKERQRALKKIEEVLKLLKKEGGR